MNPLITLENRDHEDGVLIPELAELYGSNLSLPPPGKDRPYIAVNFVLALDGLITFGLPGKESGAAISSHNPHDAFVMGLLRSVYGNMAEGANALRLNPEHLWTPVYASASFAGVFTQQSLHMRGTPVCRTFFVTETGDLRPRAGPEMPGHPAVPAVLQSPDSEAWVLTTAVGRERFLADFPADKYPSLPDRVVTFDGGHGVDLQEALRYLRQELGIKYLLVEGGGHFAGSLIGKLLYDELFLTESDLIVGTNEHARRFTFVWGPAFTPENAPKHELLSVKKDGNGGNFIFTRRRRLHKPA